MLSKVYLLLYNCCLACGWSIVLYQAIQELATAQNPTYVYERCQVALKISQTLALLEIFHAVVGLVRSSPFTTFVQVFVLWLVLDPVSEVHGYSNVPMMIIAWCVAEIVRYWYYALSLVDKVPYFLTWCRYSFFTFLYPIGVSGELLTIFSILPMITATGMFSLALPNKWNFSFNYPIFLMIYMMGYVPYLPKLYMHMLKQRSKMLGKAAVEGEKKSN
eukprot:sb/3469925/